MTAHGYHIYITVPRTTRVLMHNSVGNDLFPAELIVHKTVFIDFQTGMIAHQLMLARRETQ